MAGDRDALARQLAALVQALQTEAEPLARLRLAGEVNALRAQLGPVAVGQALVTLTGEEISTSTSPDVVLAAAKLWFLANLRDLSPIASAIGDVRVSKRGSWDEVKRGGKHDTLKLRLLPAVRTLIERGQYHGREPLNKQRTDGFVAFHFFSGIVALPEITVEAGVLIGEDADGSLLYSVSHDASMAWQKRIAPNGEGSRAPSTESDRGTGEPALDAIMPDTGPGINLSILRVLRRA